MSQPRTRHAWRQEKGCWIRSLGERGTRIRLFQKRRGGKFFRDVWIPGLGKSRRCMVTCDRAEAEKLGKILLAEFLKGSTPAVDAPLTLGELCQRFCIEASGHLDNDSRTKHDTVARTGLLLAVFGRNCEVASLTQHDVDSYARKRLAGGIRCGGGKITVPVKARSVEADVNVLRTMTRWAMTVRTNGGGRLLSFDPLFGLRRLKEKNPKQPMATVERFNKTRAAMHALAGAAKSEVECTRWRKIELALVIANATGRRLGSVRQLRWEDINTGTTPPQIRWRAEADKKRKEWNIPMSPALLAEVQSFQSQLGSAGGFVFAGERNPSQPMDRHLFDKWLLVAERKAGLPKLVGGMWHPYRRKWATERKHCSPKDVAAAGGWSNIETLVRVYQQPDARTLLAIMSEPRQLSENDAAA